jgi:AcrR family transcriptional regulator
VSVRAGIEQAVPPPRGTRPRNRRELVRTAAATLFWEKGYANVSMADVAAAVNVAPSALYRHYSGKADLLHDTVDVIMDAATPRLVEAASLGLPGIADELARGVLDYRLAPLLWQREARQLPDAQLAALKRKVAHTNERFAELVRRERPELSMSMAQLLATATIEAVGSVSYHRAELPRADYERLLAELALRVLTLRIDETDEPDATDRADEPAVDPSRKGLSRRDQLVRAAVELFDRKGFAAVSIDEIGAAVGIAGPSVYKHFASKQDLLIEAMHRGYEVLRLDLANALAEGRTPAETLRKISDGYVRMALENPAMISCLLVETVHLDDAHRRATRRTQRVFIDQWIELMSAIRPDESATVSRIKIQAAQMVANDVPRNRHLRVLPGLGAILSEICWVLQQ